MNMQLTAIDEALALIKFLFLKLRDCLAIILISALEMVFGGSRHVIRKRFRQLTDACDCISQKLQLRDDGVLLSPFGKTSASVYR